ncbi:hypothetical protein PSTT_12030 [Puccinia striiformis]|uniref:Uncharacterized protein n=2 Tax=Puccinia striiformis TaxID=27350 RepID=A0A2S4UYC8_9BASI|nr:hypothetical protein PSTT_12030 [Puccinia striiformis]
MSNTLLALFVRLSLELWEAITNTPARAILKQFVEINRHNTDKHWQQSEPPTYQNDLSQSHDTHSDSNSINTFSSTAATTQTIKSSQASTHPPDSPQTGKDWKFMKLHKPSKRNRNRWKNKSIRSGLYCPHPKEAVRLVSVRCSVMSTVVLFLRASRWLEKFILHVETLLAAIGDLDIIFSSTDASGCKWVGFGSENLAEPNPRYMPGWVGSGQISQMSAQTRTRLWGARV